MDKFDPSQPKKYSDPRETYRQALEENAKRACEIEKPHYYGKIQGVHVFHATNDEAHRSLVGMHLHNADDRTLNEALSDAKGKGTFSIVLHGAPPESLRAKIHPRLGAHKPGKMEKIEVDAIDLKKAFLQPDQQTRTDVVSHQTALASCPRELLAWGQKTLVPLPKGAIEDIPLDGRVIKINKHDFDVYSGQVLDQAGNKVHAFEKLTLPELLVQLQSKLELYGREGEATLSPREIQSKLKRLQSKVQGAIAKLPNGNTPDPDTVTVPGKDLVDGMIDPEEECPACESPVDQCSCWIGMPKPRVEFDGKKVTIFFKSEAWDPDAKEAFVSDLKRRAGRLLKQKFK